MVFNIYKYYYLYFKYFLNNYINWSVFYIYMKKIIIKDNFAFLYLSDLFYKKEAILTTIKIYDEFVSASFSNLGNYFVIKFELKSLDYKLEKIVNEFSNYLLSVEYELNSLEK